MKRQTADDLDTGSRPTFSGPDVKRQPADAHDAGLGCAQDPPSWAQNVKRQPADAHDAGLGCALGPLSWARM